MPYPHTSIHKNARIGSNVKIDPFTTIHEDVEIGDGTWIGSNAVIMPGATIGKQCKIFPGAIIGAITQDLKFKGEYSEVVIGNNTTVREFVTINRATSAGGKTVIKDNVLLMAYSHIGHDSIIDDYAIVGNLAQIAGHVHIHKYARVGAFVGVQPYTLIGESSFVAAGSTIIIKDIPPYIRAARSPLSYIGINVVGLKRRDFLPATIDHIADIYRYVYNKNLSVSQAIDAISLEFPPTKERDEILSFIRQSKQGIIRRFESVTSEIKLEGTEEEK